MNRGVLIPSVWLIVFMTSRAGIPAADLTFTGDHVTIVRSPVSQIVPVDVFLRVQNGPAPASQFRYDAGIWDPRSGAQIIGGGDPINHPDAFSDRPPQLHVTGFGHGVRASGQLSQPNVNVPLRDGAGLFHLDVEIPADTTGIFALRPDWNLTWVAQANGLRYPTRAWGPIIVITEPPPPLATANVPDARLFWTDPTAGRIHRSHVDGTQPLTVVPSAHGAESIALDVAHGYVYWAEGDPFTPELILRSNLDGSNVQTIVSKEAGFVNIEQSAGGVAVDPIHGKLYYAEGWTSTLRQVDLDGSNEEILMRDPTSAPVSVALDLLNDHIYSAHSHGTSSSVQRSNLDGSNRLTLLSVQGFLGGLDVDAVNGHLYWTDFYPNSSAIRRSNLDGSDLTTLVALEGFKPGGLQLDLFGKKVYWTYWEDDYQHQGIHRANLDGSQFESVFRTERTFDSTRIGDVAVMAIPEPVYGVILLPFLLIIRAARWTCRRKAPYELDEDLSVAGLMAGVDTQSM